MQKREIVAFDFDGTITTRDTFVEFIKFTKGKRAFWCGLLLHVPMLIAFKLNLYPNWKAKQRLFSYFFKGVDRILFDRWGEEFAERIEEISHPKAIERIKMYTGNGATVVIISASLENWIKPWAFRNGIAFVLATCAETDGHGRLTGNFCNKNCFGEEKINRLLEVFPDRRNYILFAYGDSRGDRELLQFADRGWHKAF